MAIQSSAGTTVAISAALPATNDAAGFAAVTGWAVIGEVSQVGDFGKKYNAITFNDLGTRRVRKLKGSYDPGSLPLDLAKDMDNAGQDLLRTARDSDDDHSFRVTYQDGSIDYFKGLVMDFITKIGGSDNVVGGSAEIAVNSDVVEVAAP